MPENIVTSFEHRLRRFRIVLGIWAAMSVFWFVQARIRFGSSVDDPPFDGLLDLLHPYYIGVVLTSLSIIPAVMFAPAISRAWGGLRSAVGRAVACLAMAAAAFGIGDLIWFWYTTCTSWGVLGCDASIEVPYPSWADLGYLLLLPFAAVALGSLTRVVDLRLRDAWKVVLISVVIAIPTIWMTWSIGGHGKQWLYDPAYPGFASALGQLVTFDLGLEESSNLISGIYVLSDVVLFSLALVLLLHARRTAGGLFYRPLVAVSVAFVFQYIGDMVFFQRVFAETFASVDISDVFYGLAIFTMIFAVYLFGRTYALVLQPAPVPAASDG